MTILQRGITPGNFKMETKRTKVNLVLVSISFLLNMSGYFSLEGLQSSLNSNTGTQSLSALYSSIVVSSLFLPPLAMDLLQCRKAMALSTLTYALYTIANCYPKPYTLIPAAIILGAGSSILWSSMRVYVSNLACMCAWNKGSDKEKMTAYFFGIFFTIFSLSMLIGNIMSSIIFQLSNDNSDIIMSRNIGDVNLNSSTISPILVTNISFEDEELKCGLHNCHQKSNQTIEKENVNKVDQKLLYILFSIYVGLNLIAVFILLFLADEVPNDITNYGVKKAKHNILLYELSGSKELSESTDMKGTFISESYTSDHKDDEAKNLGSNENNNSNSKTISFQGIVQKALETGKFILTNHTLKLLIPITLHLGLLQAFMYGQFTKHWITCAQGIKLLGYIMAAFGLWAAIGGILVGRLARCISRKIIILISLLMEVAIIVTLLQWEPENNNSVWIYVAICSCSGLLYSIHKTILTTTYALFFYNTKEAASASLSLWDPLGTAIAYTLSTYLCNQHILYILTGLLGLGVALYFIAEYIYGRRDEIPVEEESI